MKFICLGYYDEASWVGKSEGEMQSFMDACFADDQQLRESGCWAGGDALMSPKQAVTVRMKNGAPSATDGPFTETKEQIGGVLYLEARDLDHAIALISAHPGVQAGPFEIRAVNEQFPEVFAQWLASKKK